MTTKRTIGPCTCHAGLEPIQAAHYADCPSLYPAQQEPDALTRLARYVRQSTLHEVEKEEVLALVAGTNRRMHCTTKRRWARL